MGVLLITFTLKIQIHVHVMMCLQWCHLGGDQLNWWGSTECSFQKVKLLQCFQSNTEKGKYCWNWNWNFTNARNRFLVAINWYVILSWRSVFRNVPLRRHWLKSCSQNVCYVRLMTSAVTGSCCCCFFQKLNISHFSQGFWLYINIIGEPWNLQDGEGEI